MYIKIKKNNRGLLEIEDSALADLVSFIVRTNGVNLAQDSVKTIVNFKHDYIIFINVIIYVKNIDNQMQDEEALYKLIEEAILQTFSIKPKNVSFSYLHKH